MRAILKDWAVRDSDGRRQHHQILEEWSFSFIVFLKLAIEVGHPVQNQPP